MCAPNNIIEKHLKEKQQQQMFKLLSKLWSFSLDPSKAMNERMIAKKKKINHMLIRNDQTFLQNVGVQAGPNLLEVKILHVQ